MGELTVCPSLPEALEGKFSYQDRSVELLLFGEAGKFEASISLAATIVKNLPRCEEVARSLLARNFLDLYNHTWRGEIESGEDGGEIEQPVLDENGFKQEIELRCVSIESDGTWSIEYGDGELELFAGHSLMVTFQDGLNFRDPYTEL